MATAWLTDVCSGVVRTRAAVFVVPSWLVIGPRAEMSELAMQILRNVWRCVLPPHITNFLAISSATPCWPAWGTGPAQKQSLQGCGVRVPLDAALRAWCLPGGLGGRSIENRQCTLVVCF